MKFRAIIVDNGTLATIIEEEGNLIDAIHRTHEFISEYNQHPILIDARIFEGEEEVYKYPESVQRKFEVKLQDGHTQLSIGKNETAAIELLKKLGYKTEE